jgi:hypothetical protein
MQTARLPYAAEIAQPSFAYITVEQLNELGVSVSTIKRKISSGEWSLNKAAPGCMQKRNRLVLISSLPVELQLRWAQQHFLTENPIELTETHDERKSVVNTGVEKRLVRALLHIPSGEHIFWITEALRLSRLLVRYGEIRPKRERNPATRMYEFSPVVRKLCQEAACTDSVILMREPHRALPPSPYTLDGWWREYQKEGLLTFFRNVNRQKPSRTDKRLAMITPAAIGWMNVNWSTYYGPRPFYKDLRKNAAVQGWKIPSESWVYRQWQSIPAIVRTYYLEGREAYESKLAPYAPRDVSDLQALQILAGDHTERDVTVSLPDRTIARPWLTAWYDLRTGLIWGWYLSLAPSANTAGLAYANGVQSFGAQPFSRPDEGFYSYILTDRGRDYRSHNWDGKEIAVHKEAMRPDGGLELLLVQYRVGIVEELNLKHLLTRGKNPKENPVERVHRVISEWEQNTFDEYCGRDPKSKPERWRQFYAQHQQFKKGKRDASPFISFDQYREAIADFIARYNSSEHERLTLGGARITPLDEYSRLYTTRYEISSETLSLLLMKAEKRRVRKNGIQCFRKDWFYYHEAMSMFKGQDVEVRFSNDDYGRVFVILPNLKICEAELLTPTSLINPNKRTLKAVKQARAFERNVINDFNFIAQSNIRGESPEDRVARQIVADEAVDIKQRDRASPTARAIVHKLTRIDHCMPPARRDVTQVTAAEVARAEADTSIFTVSSHDRIMGVDDE